MTTSTYHPWRLDVCPLVYIIIEAWRRGVVEVVVGEVIHLQPHHAPVRSAMHRTRHGYNGAACHPPSSTPITSTVYFIYAPVECQRCRRSAAESTPRPAEVHPPSRTPGRHHTDRGTHMSALERCSLDPCVRPEARHTEETLKPAICPKLPDSVSAKASDCDRLRAVSSDVPLQQADRAFAICSTHSAASHGDTQASEGKGHVTALGCGLRG